MNEIGIQSVNRAIAILSLFTYRRPRLGITEISHFLSLPKGTVHGLVRTLLNAGFLQQDSETRKYQLGLKLYEMGITLAGNLEINQKAVGPANKLAKNVSLVSRIAIWDEDSALITLNIDPHSKSLFVHQIGPRIPAYCSSLGKVILAFLSDEELNAYLSQTKLVPYTPKTVTQKEWLLRELKETRQRGYSIDQEETTLGLVCIGAPIFGKGGHLEASISLSGDPSRFQRKQLKSLAEKLSKTAGEISRSMGYFPEVLRF
jgi:IclR family transcriptional regulator, KDG regulon repressor